jgi:EAL and modified HD-GYP domain-containing signal transduction protein
MCQSVAEKLRYPNGHVFFTAGLFSGLDAVLDMPLEEALSSIPLADMVRDGILNKSGDIGNILDCVLAYETGHWERWDNIVIGDSKNVQSKCELFSQAYIDSVTKAEELAKSLG